MMIITAGGWLAAGALLVVLGLAIHPPPSPDPAVFMAIIADDLTRWLISHYASAIGFALWVGAALLVLAARSPLTRQWWTASAWALVAVGSMWVMFGWLLEATVIIDAVGADDAVAFERWQALIQGLDLGFFATALGVVAIAITEARADAHIIPPWAAWIGAVAAVLVTITGFLALGLGIAAAGPGWLVSSIVLGLWALWFGIGLMRSGDDTWTDRLEHEPLN